MLNDGTDNDGIDNIQVEISKLKQDDTFDDSDYDYDYGNRTFRHEMNVCVHVHLIQYIL